MSLCFIQAKDWAMEQPAILYDSPQAAVTAASNLTDLERRDLVMAQLRCQLSSSACRQLARVFHNKDDRIYSLDDDSVHIERDFYPHYLQSMERWDTQAMGRLFRAEQSSNETKNPERSTILEKSTHETPTTASPVHNANVETEISSAPTTDSPFSPPNVVIQPNDPIETVLRKYEATGCWQRRIPNAHALHGAVHVHNSEMDVTYQSVRAFLHDVVCRDHPHWNMPKEADDDEDAEDDEAVQDDDDVSMEEDTPQQDDALSFQEKQESPPKRRRVTKRPPPRKKQKTSSKIPDSLLQSLEAIGVEVNDDGTCFFAKEPSQVFQSTEGLCRFIVMHGCPAPAKKPTRKHLNAWNKWIRSQFPKLKRRSRTLLSYSRIRAILTDPKYDIRFEVCDGKIYDPLRTRRSAAACRTDVDRFLETDHLRIANCILRKNLANDQPDILRWCAKYTGIQFWKSDRENPEDWMEYRTIKAGTAEIFRVSVDDDSSASSRPSRAIQKQKQPKKEMTRYWQTDDLPSNEEATPLLQKLGIDARDGSVRLFGKVLSMLAARKVFCRYGLPKVPEGKSETLRRWVAFANIGIASNRSSSVLGSVRSIEGDRLKKELIDLGFYFEAGEKVYVPDYRSLSGGPSMYGTKYQHGLHYFKASELLTEVRSYIRCRPDIMNDASLEVRLWACVSSMAVLTPMKDGIEKDDEFQSFLNDAEEVFNHDEDTYDSSSSSVTKPPRPSEIDVSFGTADTCSVSSPWSYGSSESEAVSEWYERTGAIPRFNDVYQYLVRAGFSWSTVFYLKTQGSKITFESHLAIATFLLTNGIPNSSALTESEREKITQWATFAFVPVPLSESGKVLRRVQPPTTIKATHQLLTRFDFTVRGKAVFPPGASNESKAFSLEEIRVFIRSREEKDFNVTPVELRPRSSRQKLSVSSEDRLALRLWAATAPDPLPEFQLDTACSIQDEEGNVEGNPDVAQDDAGAFVGGDQDSNDKISAHASALVHDDVAINEAREVQEPNLDDDVPVTNKVGEKPAVNDGSINEPGQSKEAKLHGVVSAASEVEAKPAANDDVINEARKSQVPNLDNAASLTEQVEEYPVVDDGKSSCSESIQAELELCTETTSLHTEIYSQMEEQIQPESNDDLLDEIMTPLDDVEDSSEPAASTAMFTQMDVDNDSCGFNGDMAPLEDMEAPEKEGVCFLTQDQSEWNDMERPLPGDIGTDVEMEAPPNSGSGMDAFLTQDVPDLDTISKSPVRTSRSTRETVGLTAFAQLR